jgi:hypothetical protein
MAYPRPNVTPISRGMPNLDLTDAEADGLAPLLTRTIADDRYPLSPHIQTLRGILGRLRPEPARPAASPEPRVYAPPRKGRYGRRR